MVNAYKSKITVPHVPRYFPRKRLFTQIANNSNQMAVWIDAPPGAGKTTLVSSFLDSQKNTNIWYQIDENDSDLAGFFYWLGLAVKNELPDSNVDLPLLTPEYGLGLDIFSRNFFDALFTHLGAPFTIVFDNFQLLDNDSKIHDLLVMAIESLPPATSIIIISREKPLQQYSRLQLNRNLYNISWEQLKLTDDELVPLLNIISTNNIDENVQKELMRVSQGWISGVVLYLQSLDTSTKMIELSDSFVPNVLFEYFSNEIFSSLTDETNRLLQAIALFPQFNADIACKLSGELSGDLDSDAIIETLLSKNYFITCLRGEITQYELHPLFREYLLAQSRHYYTDESWRNIRLAAADLLEQESHFGRAVELRIQCGDIPNAVRTLCEQAMPLMLQGRHETIRKWINYFPDEIIIQIPWLNYWKGISLLAVNPFEAKSILENCYPLFKQQDDVMGMYLCWCAIVDAYFFAWSDFTPASEWVSEIDWLRENHPDYPSPEIAVKVVFSAVCLLMWRDPGHPAYKTWLEEALSVQEGMPINDMTILGLVNVIHALIFNGRIYDAVILHKSIEARIDHNKISAAVLIFNGMIGALLGAFGFKSYEEVKIIVDQLVEFSISSGVYVFTAACYTSGIYFSVQKNDRELAHKYLLRMEQYTNQKKLIERGHLYFVTGHVALTCNEFSDAEKAFQMSLDITTKCSVTMPQILSMIGLILSKIELEKFSEADVLIDHAKNVSEEIKSDSMIIESKCIRAYCDLKQNKHELAEKILRSVLPKMQQLNYNICPAINARCFAKLAACAYRAGLNTQHIDKVIRHFEIVPFDYRDRIASWPWPCRITLFGDYQICFSGETATVSSKVAKKPKELLLAILTAPSQVLTARHAADMLWPDSEGDAANTSLKTTLHRLRKLLNDDNCIIMQDGKIRLDAKKLYCDAIEFDAAISRLDNVKGELLDDLEMITLLYQGELAFGYDDCNWLYGIRERYRNNYIDAVIKLGGLQQGNGNAERAITIFRSALEVDSLTEELYSGLMQCHLSAGEATQGLKVYEKCCSELDTRLGITPSAVTRTIAHQLNDLAN